MKTEISHHLDDATLMSFAAGSLPEALAVVAAAHIATCPRCAREARRMEDIGAALLHKIRVKTLSRDVPDAQACDAAVGASDAAPATAGGLHGPLGRLVAASSLDDVPWRRLAPGVWHHRIGVSGGDLRLLKIGPGRRMPEHGHGGSELTLLLAGSYTDETGTFSVGDVADLDSDHEHTPVAHPVDGCICLVASETPARFKGLVARLAQPLTGM